jgi:hypothetical protein
MLAALGLPELVWAWPPTFGTEFNFSNAQIDRAFSQRLKILGDAGQQPTEMEHAWVKSFSEAVAAKCGAHCEVTQKRGKFGFIEYLVRFKNGWHFNISVDPSVIEIQTKPETLEELQRNEEMYRKYIFEVAQDLKLNGQGQTAHFNIGTQSFSDGDVERFLRFYIDYSSNTALAEGIFGSDFDNAPPFATLDLQARAELKSVIDDWRSGKLKSVREAAERIHRKVYAKTASRFENVASAAYHYQAIGLKALVVFDFPLRDAPTELRAVRQPKSAREYVLMSELIQKRMEYLDRMRPALRVPSVGYRTYSPNEVYSRFVLYVREMGLDPKHYESLLGDEMPKSKQLDVLMSGSARLNVPSDFRVVSAYLEEYPNSPVVLEQLQSILELKKNQGEKGRKVLRDLLERAEREPELRSSASRFFERMSESSFYGDFVAQTRWRERLPLSNFEPTSSVASWLSCATAQLRSAVRSQ